MADLERAQIIQLPHDTFDEGRLSFSVLADKGHFLAAADGEIHVMEHIVFAEILAQVFHNEREVSAARGGRETEVETRGVLKIHLEAFQFFQLLDAALDLHGFGRFVAETLDELFGVLNHFLLVLERPDLLFVPFLT